MSKVSLIGVSVLIVALVIGGWGFTTYNSIVALDQATKSRWSVVEAQYQRRMDLIPNLVSTVKGAANFEQTTLTQVVEARAKATQIIVDSAKLDRESIAQYQKAQGEISTALGRLLAMSENYPTLRATENFRDLQSQLEGMENRIAVARKDFGDAVQAYNTRITQFPGNILARLFGFSEKAYFAAEEGSVKAPDVAF
jgi:LemA protein